MSPIVPAGAAPLLSIWRLDGVIEAADDVCASIWAAAETAASLSQKRRARAALRLAARRGPIKLRLSGPLAGWAATISLVEGAPIADAPGLLAVACTDQPRRLDAAVDGLMRQAAVESSGFWRVDARGRWLWSASALGLVPGGAAPRPLVEAARRGRPVVDLCLASDGCDGSRPDCDGLWLLTGRPVWDERGRPDGLVGFARSLWSWRRAAAARARLAGMASAMDPGFALYDDDGSLRFAGDAYAQAYDCDCGGGWTILGEPPAAPGPGREVGFETRTIDGRRWAVRRRGLSSGGWAESAVDVTAVRAAEREHAAAIGRARKAERTKQAFVDAVGGEVFAAAARINTALAQLRANLSPDDSALYPNFVEMMDQGWRRLWRTARDVRAFNLLESDSARLADEVVELTTALAAATASLRDAAAAAGVTLAARPGRTALVRADARLIELALEHLLSNAVKFTPAGGHVTASLRATPEGGWALEIRDDGIGVASEDLSRIHEPFIQADGDAAHRVYEGSGLGLALCRAVARLHGGRLEFSSALGAGATARLILPPERCEDPPCERTQQRKAEAAEAARRRAVALDQRLFVTAPIPLARLDAAGVVTAANDRARALFDALVGQPLAARLSPGAESIAVTLFAGGVVERVWRTREQDLWARVTLRPLADGGMLTAWEDDTEICRMEELAEGDLARAPDPVAVRLREALDAAPVGVIHWDADDRLVYVNPGYRVALPWVYDQLRIGMSFHETARLAAIAGDMASSDADAWTAERMERRRLAAAMVERPLADGRWGLWSDRRTPDGGVVGVRMDVTDRRLAEAKLAATRRAAEQADRAKTNFMAVMSHEMRTPLNSIVGFADLMRNQSFGPIAAPSALTALAAIVEHGLTLQRLVSNILEFSRVDSGEFLLREQEESLAALLAEVTAAAGQRAAALGVAVRLIESVDAPMRWDPAAIRAALNHLIDDATRRSPSGGVVTVAAAVDPALGVRVQVCDPGADDGPSLLAALRASGDDPLSLATALGGDRRGLGFAICRRLLALHGGGVSLSDSGGVATVTLPPDRIVADAA